MPRARTGTEHWLEQGCQRNRRPQDPQPEGAGPDPRRPEPAPCRQHITEDKALAAKRRRGSRRRRSTAPGISWPSANRRRPAWPRRRLRNVPARRRERAPYPPSIPRRSSSRSRASCRHRFLGLLAVQYRTSPPPRLRLRNPSRGSQIPRRLQVLLRRVRQNPPEIPRTGHESRCDISCTLPSQLPHTPPVPDVGGTPASGDATTPVTECDRR